MEIQHNMKVYLDNMNRQVRNIDALLAKAPEGKLITKLSHGKTYYYVIHDNKSKESLLGKINKLSTYTRRDYFLNKRNMLINNIYEIEKFLNNYQPLPYSSLEFEAMQHNQNKYKFENAKHKFNDIYFRSKSEVNFAQLLTSFNIPFWYEPQLTLRNGHIIYPDFIIKRPSDGKIIVIEYFGMMDKDDYRASAIEKIKKYRENGYYLWDNFIAIFEYENNAIDMDSLNRLIRAFVL